jgi:hypothetical protein
MASMDTSNVAAYSLQAGMTLKELWALLETLGRKPSQPQVREIVRIRRDLCNTGRELR